MKERTEGKGRNEEMVIMDRMVALLVKFLNPPPRLTLARSVSGHDSPVLALCTRQTVIGFRTLEAVHWTSAAVSSVEHEAIVARLTDHHVVINVRRHARTTVERTACSYRNNNNTIIHEHCCLHQTSDNGYPGNRFNKPGCRYDPPRLHKDCYSVVHSPDGATCINFSVRRIF